MTASFTGNLGGSVRQDYIIPDDNEQMKIRIRQYFNDIASSLNVKDSGYYVQTETITGQLFLPNFGINTSSNVAYRPVFRTVVPFGALSTGANTVAHGLTIASSWHFTRIYGVIEDTAAPLYVPIPNDTVLVTVDGTNINITIPVAYNNFAGRVILEYVKED